MTAIQYSYSYIKMEYICSHVDANDSTSISQQTDETICSIYASIWEHKNTTEQTKRSIFHFSF